jgi:hypothetical protein
MLKRRGQVPDVASDTEIAAVFGHHLQEVQEWLQIQSHIEVLFID